MIFYIRHMSELLILAFKKAINIHYFKKCTKRTDNNTHLLLHEGLLVCNIAILTI
jgi:hypothetical protein